MVAFQNEIDRCNNKRNDRDHHRGDLPEGFLEGSWVEKVPPYTMQSAEDDPKEGEDDHPSITTLPCGWSIEGRNVCSTGSYGACCSNAESRFEDEGKQEEECEEGDKQDNECEKKEKKCGKEDVPSNEKVVQGDVIEYPIQPYSKKCLD